MKAKWTERWTVDFVDWAHDSGVRANLSRNGNTATVWSDAPGKYHVAINFELKKTFNWPSQAKRYAIRVLSAKKGKRS